MGSDEDSGPNKRHHRRHGSSRRFFRSTTFYVVIALFFGASVVAIILASIAFSNSGTDGAVSGLKGSVKDAKNTRPASGYPLKSKIPKGVKDLVPRGIETDLERMINESEEVDHNKYSAVVGYTEDGKEMTRTIHIFTERVPEQPDSKKRSVNRAKSPRPSSPPPNNGSRIQPNGPECKPPYTLGFIWRATEPYMIDTNNMNFLTSVFIRSVIHTAVGKWNSIPDNPIFGTEITYTGDGPDFGAPDGKNEIDFGEIDTDGVLAYCITWGISSGPIAGRAIIEFDIRFDDRDYTWGDGRVNPTKRHLMRVAVHELGHAAGLGHSPCVSSPMYSSSPAGRIDPEFPSLADKLSICDLYGCSEIPTDSAESLRSRGLFDFVSIILLVSLTFW